MFSGTFQPIHWLLVILVAVVIFGPGKLGQLGANLGKSIRDFKDALSEKDVTPAPPAQPAATQVPPQPAQAQTVQAQATQTPNPQAQPAQQASAGEPRKDA